MPNRLAWTRRRGLRVMFVGTIHVAFQRAAHEVARSQPHSQRKRKHDAAEENPEGQQHHAAADFKMLKHHGGGQNEDQPLDSERQEPRVLKLRIDSPDENRSCQEAGNQGTGDQQKNGAHRVRQVRQQ